MLEERRLAPFTDAEWALTIEMLFDSDSARKYQCSDSSSRELQLFYDTIAKILGGRKLTGYQQQELELRLKETMIVEMSIPEPIWFKLAFFRLYNEAYQGISKSLQILLSFVKPEILPQKMFDNLQAGILKAENELARLTKQLVGLLGDEPIDWEQVGLVCEEVCKKAYESIKPSRHAVEKYLNKLKLESDYTSMLNPNFMELEYFVDKLSETKEFFCIHRATVEVLCDHIKEFRQQEIGESKTLSELQVVVPPAPLYSVWPRILLEKPCTSMYRYGTFVLTKEELESEEWRSNEDLDRYIARLDEPNPPQVPLIIDGFVTPAPATATEPMSTPNTRAATRL
jgi:hypothetical protein